MTDHPDYIHVGGGDPSEDAAPEAEADGKKKGWFKRMVSN